MVRQLTGFRRYKPVLMVAVPVVLMTAGLGYLVWLAMGETQHTGKKFVQQVQLLRPPPPPEEAPPPPPPPPEVEKPPEDVAKDDSNEPPPGDLLGLDAEGVAGADGFGLAARKGGRDLIGGGDSDAFDRYKNTVGAELLGRLSDNDQIRRRRYSVRLRLWLTPDGRIERFHLDGTTGDQELDRKLSLALSDLGRISEAPPEGLPQPVRLRIVSRI